MMAKKAKEVDFVTDITQIKNLVFAPAGVAGISYAGVVQSLEKHNLLDSLEAVAGVSSGAFTAWIVALGYRGDKLEKILADKDFNDFATMSMKDLGSLVSGETKRLWGKPSHNGVYSGSELRRWSRTLAAQRLGKPNITFSQLYTYIQKAKQGDIEFFTAQVVRTLSFKVAMRKALRLKKLQFDFEEEGASKEQMGVNLMEIALHLKELKVVAAEIVNPKNIENMDKRYKEIVFETNTMLDEPIAQAIRLSASYPFFFRNGKIIEFGKRRLFTDGGLINQYPAEMFDEGGEVNPHTLVVNAAYSKTKMKDDSSEPKLFEKKREALVRKYFGEERISRVTRRLIKLGLKGKSDPNIASRLVEVDRGDVGPTDFNISDGVKKHLVRNGFAAMEAVVEKFKGKNIL